MHYSSRPSNPPLSIPHTVIIYFVLRLLPLILLSYLTQVVCEAESNFSIRDIRKHLVNSDVAI